MKNGSEMSKNCVDQIFTGKNNNTSRIFDDFRGLRVFSMEFRLVCQSVFWFCLQKSEELPLACVFEVFTGLWLSTPTFCIIDYDYIKRSARVLVLLVINTGCLKKLLKNGEHQIVVFQFKLC